MVIHHVTFSGPEIFMTSTQKRLQCKRIKTHVNFFLLLYYVSNYQTYTRKKHQSAAHNSAPPLLPQKKRKSTLADPIFGSVTQKAAAHTLRCVKGYRYSSSVCMNPLSCVCDDVSRLYSSLSLSRSLCEHAGAHACVHACVRVGEGEIER